MTLSLTRPNDYPQVVGFTGPARSGKDSAARVLYELYGYAHYSLATPLKRGLMAMFGMTIREFEVAELKESVCESFPECGRSPRYMMQTLGTEWGRELIHPDIWLLLAARHLALFQKAGKRMVLSDVRFENEAEWVRRNGVLIHVTRADAPAVLAHSSEAGVEVQDGDVRIRNDGTLYDLRHHVTEIMEFIGEVNRDHG